MATSTEQINDLISGYTDLKVFFEDAKTDLKFARENLPANIRKVIYVSEATGQPGNPGTADAPLSSFDDALDSVLPGTVAEIRLLTVCNWTRRRFGFNAHVTVKGWSLITNAAVTTNLLMAAVATNGVNLLPGVSGGGSLIFQTLQLRLPQNDPALTDACFAVSFGFLAISFQSATLNGTGGTCPLVSPFAGTFSLGVTATTISNMVGRVALGCPSSTPLTFENCGGLVDPAITN